MSNSQEVSVLDEKHDEQVTMHQIQINEKDRRFLSALQESDEPLTTSEIRERTGLNRKDTDYRYDKFGRKQYTEIVSVREADPSVLNRQVKGMKEAELTEKGEKLMRMGLVGDPSDEYTQDEMVVNRERFEKLEDQNEMLENRVDEITNRCERQQEQIERHQYMCEKSMGFRSRVEPYILAFTWIVKEHMDVDFSYYLSEARDQIHADESSEEASKSDE